MDEEPVDCQQELIRQALLTGPPPEPVQEAPREGFLARLKRFLFS